MLIFDDLGAIYEKEPDRVIGVEKREHVFSMGLTKYRYLPEASWARA